MIQMPNYDTKFFTNKEDYALYDRFNTALRHTQYFDILVGYFRASGFYRLQEAFENIDKVRILVGLNVDKATYDIHQLSQHVATSTELKNAAIAHTVTDVTNADDTQEIENGILKFVELLKNKKIEIKAHPSQNIHAKVYIMRHPDTELDFGRVITGSSNFSEQGLVARREFNVELKDKPDVDFALEQFEELWADGIDISEAYVDAIVNKTGLRQDISPYILYLKFLYEYFREEIDDDLAQISINYPPNFMQLAYQIDAVKNAKRILSKYNGVFLSDVVGLGKTYITAMLLQNLDDGLKIVLCPPNLVEYWKETLLEFGVAAEVKSQYQIDEANAKKYDRFKYVIIDEAHRFRNDRTSGYAKIRDLVCKGKKVILVSATPFNNSVVDIKNLINMFIDLRNSPFKGIENLAAVFDSAEKDLKFIEKTSGKDSQEYTQAVDIITGRIREKILRPLMVRRTRTEIQEMYKDDIKKQKLKFPKVMPPKDLVYQFDTELEKAFNTTIELLKQDKDKSKNKFVYARYMPLTYLKNLDARQVTQQKNVGNFMKMLLVKRLESSSYAFKQTLNRFITSYENFIKMYNEGTVYIGHEDVFKYLDMDDTTTLEAWENEGKIDKYKSSDFRKDFLPDLESDLEVLKQLQQIWDQVDTDPKLVKLAETLRQDCKSKKVIIFTEAKDTADYLFEQLAGCDGCFDFEKNAIFEMCGNGGRCYLNNHTIKTYDVKTAKTNIELSFNPKEFKPGRDGDIRILITTDVLAEGVNLHQSNIILNYDLPWNPTRVMQRAGRINRIGTRHDEIYSYNFFPTTTSDAHLGLKDNIVNKLRMFTNLLGDDNPLLEASENVGQYHLAEALYENIHNSVTETESDEFGFVNRYLQLLRNIRDNQPDLFNQIKTLPRKIKVGVKSDNNTAVLTFFRKGMWTEFVLSKNKKSVSDNNDKFIDLSLNLLTFGGEETKNLSLLETIKLFECSPTEQSVPLPDDYFELLNKNKQFIEAKQNINSQDNNNRKASSSKNTKTILALIKQLLNWKKLALDEDEKSYLSSAYVNIPNMAPSPTKKLAEILLDMARKAKEQSQELPEPEKHKLRIKLLADIKKELKNYEIYWRPATNVSGKDQTHAINEVILSKCFIGGE